MNHALACRRFRRAALEAGCDDASQRSARNDSAEFVAEHASSCAKCAAWSSRLPRREALLRAVPRVTAPDELRGRVVAALHAGERQARAIRELSGLGRLAMPGDIELVAPQVARADETDLDRKDELDSLAESAVAADDFEDELASANVAPGERPEFAVGRREVPAVLDRLVAEELLDPARARVARFVGTLPRLSAPAELASRVAGELARPAPRPTRVSWWIAGAAALVIVAFAPIFLSSGQTVPAPVRERSFRVEQVDSFADLSPFGRGLLDTASSGMVQHGNS